MKIAICGSMSAAEKMVEVKNTLEKEGHIVELPRNTERYMDGALILENSNESTQNKIDHDLIRRYFGIIRDSDAVLVVNEEKNGIKGYIGGNTFLEMGFAYVLNKPIYLLNSMPKLSYTDELLALKPKIISGNLSFIE